MLSNKLLPPSCPNCREEGKVKIEIKAKFNVYFCHNCHNGFTFPVPGSIEAYYPEYYWSYPHALSFIKNAIFNIFQRRRIIWLTKSVSKGFILDVGSGEGGFATLLSQKYQAVSLEPPGSLVKNRVVIKRDFLKWDTGQKFNAVCFWESLEHTAYPQKYLQKAYSLLINHGRIFIEFPRYQCLESRLFGKNWFHLDTPRHLSHLTDKGIINLLKRAGFTNITLRSVSSFDYTPWGFIASTLNLFNIQSTDYVKKKGSVVLVILLLPLGIISLFFEILLIIIGQSPIGLASAEKLKNYEKEA